MRGKGGLVAAADASKVPAPLMGTAYRFLGKNLLIVAVDARNAPLSLTGTAIVLEGGPPLLAREGFPPQTPPSPARFIRYLFTGLFPFGSALFFYAAEE